MLQPVYSGLGIFMPIAIYTFHFMNTKNANKYSSLRYVHIIFYRNWAMDIFIVPNQYLHWWTVNAGIHILQKQINTKRAVCSSMNWLTIKSIFRNHIQFHLVAENPRGWDSCGRLFPRSGVHVLKERKFVYSISQTWSAAITTLSSTVLSAVPPQNKQNSRRFPWQIQTTNPVRPDQSMSHN